MRLAAAAMVVAVFVVTLAGAWVEARWPNAAGAYITVRPQGPADVAEVLWQLRHLDGVREALAVFRGDVFLEETQDTPWLDVWFQANHTDAPHLAFLPPAPTLRVWQGRLPVLQSLDEAILGYELAQALHLRVGDELLVRNRAFHVVGIWSPSAHVPGNLIQISAAVAEAIEPSSFRSPDHFVVVPTDVGEATQTARRIWRTMPEMEVRSPDWEVAQAKRERTVLGITLIAAVVLAFLLAIPAWASGATERQRPTMLVALLCAVAGLAGAWAVIVLANLYARVTLGLTPFAMTPRLAIANLAMAGLMQLLGFMVPFGRAWPLRYASTALLLALCGTVLVTVGALSESLGLSLSEAQRAATDWVTIVGVEADQRLLQALYLVPGIRGYVIEAYGGLADEDEERWLGPWPPSGVFYGLVAAGGEGTLSLPYRLGYWQVGPLDPAQPDQAVVGYDLAQELGLTVGDTIPIRGVPFVVVGICERLRYDPGSDANYRIDISLEALRRVLHQPSACGEMTLLIPPAENQEEKAVFLQELRARLGVDRVLTIPDRLAEIARSYPAAWTLTPASSTDAVRHAQVSYANAVLLCGVFLLAMCAMSVAGATTERLARDEQRIALLKALGSDEGTLLGDYLQIAAILGVVGGLMGIAGGWALSSFLNRVGPYGAPELILTPRLGAGVFFVMAVTAIAAAAAPVTNAVRQDATGPLYPSFLSACGIGRCARAERP